MAILKATSGNKYHLLMMLVAYDREGKNEILELLVARLKPWRNS